ncbi:hypothetical protein ASE12_06305 [Aeromicrobium sp. Root236]|uniref:FAD-dependent oxidoreductase n=1 Tax=Aeromicrobium sp. Root236 TaxID=1736498 RepID=UPI0006FBE7AF|nr:FAD-dependent oxidoreductase [Aeromicrobium sp. Root236]KRC64413.1 hypothetical protein ASE12_06305 [Aeromicrobium sp. Root236]
MDETEIAVIGAGPHGLGATERLRAAGREVCVIGDPMAFWHTMPKGLWMRSRRNGSSIGEVTGPLSMEGYTADTQAVVDRHLKLTTFIEYGHWYQNRVAPDVIRRHVVRLERQESGFLLTLSDGTQMRAGRVISATGIAEFTRRPAMLRQLPGELASHVADHGDYERFRGKSVAIIGAGQSALESAALMHEGGAEVEVLARHPQVHWLHGDGLIDGLGRLAPLFYAPTDVGPIGISRLVATPEVFRRFPRPLFDVIAARAIRPAGASWLKPRLPDVPITAGAVVTTATPLGDQLALELSDGTRRQVDHLLFATGYDVDIRRYSYLDRALAEQVRCVDGYPVLRRGLESSVPRLHFLGAPAARSFGPVMRFVAGSWFSSKAVAKTVAAQDRRRPSQPSPRHAAAA